ncbi:MAG TPA: YetF domain-containing protein [Candidatus Saccharimonadales bacterium]|nr:YetF domain-containing protein [Candidatus Saccharimonadales bacterium]
MKNSNRVFGLIIVVLTVIVAILAYQIYQVNNNLVLLKSELIRGSSNIVSEIKLNETMKLIDQNNNLSRNITSPSEAYQISPNAYNSPSLSEESGLSNGQGGSGSGSGGSASPVGELIRSALVPDLSALLSVIIRTAIIAVLVFLIIKWLGGKGIGQLSPFGLLIVVGLGSAIGDPMVYNEISIPQAMVAVIIVVIFFKVIDHLTLKSKKFKESIEPKPILLVNYGEINKDGLKKAKMDMEEFEIEMRLAGIETVGEIKFSRLEPNGKISFILRSNEKNKTNY